MYFFIQLYHLRIKVSVIYTVIIVIIVIFLLLLLLLLIVLVIIICLSEFLQEVRPTSMPSMRGPSTLVV